MKVNALDHVNITTDDLKGTTHFFADIFGLDIRDGPEPLPPEHVQWLYDDQGRAIFHINSKEMSAGISTGNAIRSNYRRNPSCCAGLQRSQGIYRQAFSARHRISSKRDTFY